MTWGDERDAHKQAGLRQNWGTTQPEPTIVSPPAGRCMILDCILPSAQSVYLTVAAEWPSGRTLDGRIRQEVRTCERHFEDLAHGVALSVRGRAIEE